MIITRIDNTALECRLPDGIKLGFPTGVTPRSFNSADTVALKKVPGVIISADGSVSEWPLERFVEYKGEMAAAGPWVEDTSPLSADSLTIEDLSLIISAAVRLNSDGPGSGGFNFSSVRRLSGGGFLFFPPRLTAWLQEIRPEDETSVDREYWNHPDLTGENAWSFSLGMAVWTILASADPFEEETGEDRRERIRLSAYPSIISCKGDLSPKDASIIDRALQAVPEDIPSLEEWRVLIDRWIENGVSSVCGSDEAALKAESAKSEYKKKVKSLGMRRWLRRSGWKAAVAVAAAALVVAFAWGPVKKALEIPQTAGMNQTEVARTYYKAMNNLNSELMGQCLARKVGKNDTQMVDTIYVTSKIRQGYEGLGDLPDVSQWIKDGRPEIKDGMWPWGITELSISSLPDGRVHASYRIWFPPEAGGTKAVFEGVMRQDVLSFTQGRRSWQISEIQRTLVE